MAMNCRLIWGIRRNSAGITDNGEFVGFKSVNGQADGDVSDQSTVDVSG